MNQLKAYSQLLDETVDLGLPSDDFDELLQLGDMMATSRPGLIVYFEEPVLPRWEGFA